MKPKDLNKQSDRNKYAESNEERVKRLSVVKQYGYMSSCLRFIKKFEQENGKQNFVIEQLDENCFEVRNVILKK